MTRVRSGDVELNVVERGKGVPLLLIHGFPLDHSMWKRQIDELSDQYRVIAPDLRGFGKSDVTPGTVTMAQFADDLASMVDAMKISEPIVFVGLSMGGYVGWQFWRRHANRLRALILCDTRAVADSEEAARDRLSSADQVVESGVEKLVESMVPKLFSDRTLRDRSDIVDDTRRVIRSTPPEGIAAALRGMAQRPDVTSDLPNIGVPALILCGEHDVISRVSEMRDFARLLPRARFELIPEAGHMSPLENPTVSNAAMRKFLAENVQ